MDMTAEQLTSLLPGKSSGKHFTVIKLKSKETDSALQVSANRYLKDATYSLLCIVQ